MEPDRSCNLWERLRVGMGLVFGLRGHDFRAARSFMNLVYGEHFWPVKLLRMCGWALRQMFGVIPDALTSVSFAEEVSRTSIWLAEGNPLANHPWEEDSQARLPEEVEVVVIGAGMTGASCAYHWAKQGGGERMAVLEMEDPAWGASGRNEGLVVMGRYFAMVRDTVRPYLERVRGDLSEDQRGKLAEQFAAAYARSAYRNADLIEQVIEEEGFACDYTRNGWIQARDEADQLALEESIEAGKVAGFDDWTSLSPEEVWEKGGMRVEAPAGFSRRAASFHPARWVWCLLEKALESSKVQLFTRTRVLKVEEDGERYLVRTERGEIRTRFVINAVEAHTAGLHPQYGEFIHPVQTQAAFGTGGPENMKPHVGLSGKRGFFGGHGEGAMVGSDASRIPPKRANCNNPSRFVTKFLMGELHRYFGRSRLYVTHEWSGTPGFTADEFPVVGLLDGKRQYAIGGMCGSGTGVSFNAARHVVQQILGIDGPDDYPAEYFGPSRLLDPQNHPWPEIEEES
jgi:glycine/D-amino acid oxidase-like deaminating enzyme